MNSFISVSKRTEARVVLVLVALLLVVEVFFRVAGDRLSNDARNIERIDAVAQQMGSALAPRWLFVGNSILQAGIDPDLLLKSMKVQGVAEDLKIYMAYPDSSHALIWDYLVKRYFMEPGLLPETLVLVTGRLHLLDAPANTAHLGAYYVSWSDVPRYLREDSDGFETRVEFFLGRSLASMRYRQRVSPRVFDLLLPYYQENWYLLNQAAMKGPLVERAGQSANEGECRHLKHLITHLKSQGVKLLVVKAPMLKPYELHPTVQKVLSEEKVTVWDVNPLPGLSAAHFADVDHLNEAGKRLFTEALGTALGKGWQD